MQQRQQQDAPEDQRTATISDVIRGRKSVVPSKAVVEGGGGGGGGNGAGGGANEQRGWETAFEVISGFCENVNGQTFFARARSVAGSKIYTFLDRDSLVGWERKHDQQDPATMI